MTYKDLSDNDDLQTNCDVDEFHELASVFALVSAAKSVPAKRRRVYADLSRLCDAAWLAKGLKRKPRVAHAHTALAQLEKSVRTKAKSKRRRR